MVDTSEDQSTVHFQRANDVMKSDEFAGHGIVRPAGSDTEGRLDIPEDTSHEEVVDSIPDAVAFREAAESGKAGTEAQVLVDSAPPAPPEEPGAALRRARLGVCACIVLALLLAWIVQRRQASTR